MISGVNQSLQVPASALISVGWAAVFRHTWPLRRSADWLADLSDSRALLNKLFSSAWLLITDRHMSGFNTIILRLVFHKGEKNKRSGRDRTKRHQGSRQSGEIWSKTIFYPEHTAVRLCYFFSHFTFHKCENLKRIIIVRKSSAPCCRFNFLDLDWVPGPQGFCPEKF